MHSVVVQSYGNSRELEGQGGEGSRVMSTVLTTSRSFAKDGSPTAACADLLSEKVTLPTRASPRLSRATQQKSQQRSCDLQRPGLLALVLARPDRHGRHMAHRLEAVNQLLWALEPAGEPAHVHGAAPAMVHSRCEKRLACGRGSRVKTVCSLVTIMSRA